MAPPLATAVDAHARAVAAALDAAGAPDQVETLLLDTAAVYGATEARPPRAEAVGEADVDPTSGDALLAAALAAGDAVVEAAGNSADERAGDAAIAAVAAGELCGGGALDGVTAALFEGER